MDILAAILALITGTDTPAPAPTLACEDTHYAAPCMFIHDDNPWLSNADGSVTILRYV